MCRSLRNHKHFQELFLLSALLIFFYWLYFHSCSQGTYKFLDYRQGTYYRILASQLMKGSLGISSENVALGDWALYKGTYYLCSGPLPAILWLVARAPFSLLRRLVPVYQTSITMSELTLIFSLINLLAFYALIRNIERHLGIRSDKTMWMRMVFFASYGLGPLYFMASRYFVYESSIIFGSTFLLLSSMLFLEYFNLKSHSTRRKITLLLSSALMLSLAFFSRIPLIACSLPYTMVIIFKEFVAKDVRCGKIRRSDHVLPLASFLIPVAFSVLIFGFYNLARFESMFEFGITYQQVGLLAESERIARGLTASVVYLPRNLYHILFLTPCLSWDKPFIVYSYPEWLVGEYPRLVNVEWVSSIFFSSPLLLYLFWTIVYFKRERQWRNGVRHNILVLIFTVVFASGYGLLWQSYARRYWQDYYPYLVVLSFLGFVYFWKSRRPRWNTLSVAVSVFFLVAGLIWTFVVAFNLNVQWAFQSDFDRALRLYNDPSTFVFLCRLLYKPEDSSFLEASAFKSCGKREKSERLMLPRWELDAQRRR